MAQRRAASLLLHVVSFTKQSGCVTDRLGSSTALTLQVRSFGHGISKVTAGGAQGAAGGSGIPMAARQAMGRHRPAGRLLLLPACKRSLHLQHRSA